MTLNQLKYAIIVAESESFNEAAKKLFISQPSLSNSIKETEKEAGITIFLRSRTGITLTKDGAEFLGYARQVIQQMELLEDRYVTNLPGKVIEENHLMFTELFSAKPHVFLQKDHPLASKKVVSVHDLAPYPRLNFVQGEYESAIFQRNYSAPSRWIRKFGSMTEGLLSTSCSD